MAKRYAKTQSKESQTRGQTVSDSIEKKPRNRIGYYGDGLQNIVTGMGTASDKSYYTGYSYTQPLTRDDVESMFRQSWLSKRIVTLMPDDMTRNWRTFFLEDTSKIESIKKYEEKIKVRAKLLHGMYWGRLYGGAIGVMITDDMDFNDPNSTREPLDLSKIKRGSLKNIIIYDRWRLSWNGELVEDITSPDFGLPKYYTLSSNQEMNASVPTVHHTRCLRFNGDSLPYIPWVSNARWDDSVLQVCYDAIINNESIKQNVKTMTYDATVGVLKLKGLMQTLETLGDEGEEVIKKRLNTLLMGKNVSKDLTIDADDDYEKRSSSFANLDSMIKQYDTDVAGASKYPITKLFGQSAAGMSSTGTEDEVKYYDTLQSEREHKLDPNLEKLDSVLIPSSLGEMPSDYRYEWPSFWQQSELEQSEIELNRAKRDQIYAMVKAVSPQKMAAELKENNTYSTLTDEDVKKASDEVDNDSDVIGDPVPNVTNPDNDVKEPKEVKKKRGRPRKEVSNAEV